MQKKYFYYVRKLSYDQFVFFRFPTFGYGWMIYLHICITYHFFLSWPLTVYSSDITHQYSSLVQVFWLSISSSFCIWIGVYRSGMDTGNDKAPEKQLF